MTPKRVRIRVRCEACGSATILSPEQYRTLVKASRVTLLCARCRHRFEYNPIGVGAAVSAPQPPAEVDLAIDLEPLPPTPAEEPVSVEEPVRAAAPEFPPPPFAPLGMGAAAPAKTPVPAFAPMGREPAGPDPAAPAPHRSEGAAGNEGKPLTLNDRWKRLPPWVQWLVVGLTVVLLGVVIFAMPVGGSGNGKPEGAAPAASDSRPAKPHPDPAPAEAPKPEERQP